MKYALALVGVLILVAGIAGAGVSYSNVSNAAFRMTMACLSDPLSAECINGAAAVSSAWTMVWMFSALAVVGFVVLIVGIVLGAAKSEAALGPGMVPGMAPGGTPSAGTATANCPRCGRPVRWIAQYQRWFCDSEATYV